MADNAYLAVFGVVACFFLTLLKRQNARRKFALAVHLKSVQRHRALILLEQRRQNNKTNLHEKIKRWHLSQSTLKCEKTAREHLMTDVLKHIYPALAEGKFSLYHGKFLLFWTTFSNVSNGVYTGDIFTAVNKYFSR